MASPAIHPASGVRPQRTRSKAAERDKNICRPNHNTTTAGRRRRICAPRRRLQKRRQGSLPLHAAAAPRIPWHRHSACQCRWLGGRHFHPPCGGCMLDRRKQPRDPPAPV
eukprot:1157325-Pelagomonas_calceolata.AAC.4